MSGIDLRRAENGYFYIHWTEGRRSRRASTSTKDLDAAKICLAEWLTLERTAPKPEAKTPTCGELWALYMSEHVEKECVDCDRHRYAWKALKPAFAELRPAAVTREVVARHIASRVKAKPSTVSVELRLLLASWAFGVKRRAIASTDVPVADDLSIPNPPPPRERWLRKEEVERLLAAAAAMRPDGRLSRVERFIHIAVKTGARRTAILELTWEQVDFETRVIHFNPEGRQQTKKRRASVPMTDGLVDVLIRAHAERTGPLVLDHATRMPDALKAAGERAGVAGVTHNVFRHTTATWLARGGMPLWKISKILGNTLEHVERSYAKHNLDDLREGVKLLDD